MSDEQQVDVAIVGFGPVGVTAANHLGQYGLRVAVFERDHDIYQRARAVTVNDWTLRVFQGIGLDEIVKADMDENGALQWKTYDGKEVFRLHPRATGIGHPGSMMIYQPVMEASLREGVERFSKTVQVHFGESVTGVEQDAEGVTLTVEPVAGGEVAGGEVARRVRARYVLACDGGSSRVRQEVGATMIGRTHETTWIVIDAEMLRWWPDCDQLVFWSDAERPVVDIPLALGHHRWEFPLRDDERREDFDTEEKLWSLLEPLGVTRDNVRLSQHAFYVHHVRHADRWRVGRVFLVGDAAHLMPPWAGQGMQSGIRDAQNIAWKLRAVIEGRLPDTVLDTYQPERAPHVAAMTEMSEKLGSLIATRNPLGIRVRNTLGPVIKRIPAISAALMPSTAPAIGEGWLRGAPGKTSAVGRMFPQPSVCDARGRQIRLDDALGDGFAVLGLDVDPRQLMGATEVAQWERLGARWLVVRSPRTMATDDADMVDHTGTLAAWMGQYRTRGVALRPDRFVAASEPSGLAPPGAVLGVDTVPS